MWHEARRSERKVHDMMDAARQRASDAPCTWLSGAAIHSSRFSPLDVADALYQATEDQQGLIPWNGKQDVLIDRFDGRALLDYIRDGSARRFRALEKTEEEEEFEEFVNFEHYRDLIKHRCRGCGYR